MRLSHPPDKQAVAKQILIWFQFFHDIRTINSNIFGSVQDTVEYMNLGLVIREPSLENPSYKIVNA